ncbi:MAG: hypothetical protein OEU32_05060 [Acidimicrobiia bacterium]|nr:hypothetical protein [Acidimicrobiia bacterium]
MSHLVIGQVSVYFGLFDDAMPAGFRKGREAHAEAVGALLAEHGQVIFPGVIDSEDGGRRAARELAAAGVDVVVFAPTMAAPPNYAWAAVAGLADTPIITLAAQESGVVPDDYDTEQATRRSLPVGLAMFTNVLVRRSRPFMTVVGELDSASFRDDLADALRVAGAVARVRAAPFAVIGPPIPGYDDVMASADDLQRLGVRAVDVTAAELSTAFAAVEDDEVDRLEQALDETNDATAVRGPVLHRSARLALAMESVCDQHGVCGGAVNCHSDVLRWNSDIGVTACLGVSRLSTSGRPFACTGDLPTGILLVLGRELAGSALYCELYQLDLPGDWVLVANGGEGDMSMRPPGSPVRLLPEDHYAGEHGAGTAVAFALAVGPATLVSLTPAADAKGGWVLVAAEGHIIDSRHDTMEGPNGMFRFASGRVADGYGRWCRAGATHHAALLPGHQVGALRDATDLLSIELAEV